MSAELPAWGAMEWLAEDALAPGVGLSLARMLLHPAQTAPAHRHPNCTEVVHLLEGRVLVRIGKTWHLLEAGDTLVIPAGETHQSRNAGKSAAHMMIAYSAGTRVYEDMEAD